MDSSIIRTLARRACKVPRIHTRAPQRSFATIESASKDPAEFDEVSCLPNGLRVATEALPGPFSGVGVYIDAGSRYEDDELRGVSHIIDRLAFKSTKARTSDEMIESLESLGGNIHCASSRETLMYQSATFNSAVPTTLGLLAETIRDPLISEAEVQEQLETASYEIGEIWSKPDLILPELVHIAAYKDNTLGNPLLCPQERLPFINKSLVEKYRQKLYRPERLVVAFAGVQHQEALRLAEKYFGDMKPLAELTDQEIGSETSSRSVDTTSLPPHLSSYSSPSLGSSSPSKLLSKIPFFKNISTSASHNASIATDTVAASTASSLDFRLPSHYTGGFLSLPRLPPPPNPAIPAVSHIHLAFEAFSIVSEDIYALATLQTLLGGGGSFSAGGPGKGMYSRLYTNVLNQFGWVESCLAFNHSYTDSGLFGIIASCKPSHTTQMLEVMCRELHALTLDSGLSSLQPAEVSRAKNQLKSSLLMNLESRMVELEDLGRQVQVHGRKVGVREMCRKVDALTVQELRRVARLVLAGGLRNAGGGSGAPTVVLQESEVGGSKRALGWPEIQERIAKWKLGRR